MKLKSSDWGCKGLQAGLCSVRQVSGFIAWTLSGCMVQATARVWSLGRSRFRFQGGGLKSTLSLFNGSLNQAPRRVLFRRVPYYLGIPKREPNARWRGIP